MASYYINKKNQYGVRFLIIENGKKVHKNLSPFSTQKQAEEAYINYLIKSKEEKQYKNITIKKLVEDYLRSNENKESSNVDALSIYNLFVLPLFGDWKIENITKSNLAVWQDILSKMGYSYPYKKKIRSRFNQLLEYASERYDYTNPFQKVKPFKKPNTKGKEIEIITFEEFTAIMNAIDNEVYKLYFTTLYYTGLRPKEASALTWNDIDFTNFTLKVDKTLTRKISKEDREKGITYKVTPPKTISSNRTIAISKKLRDTLYSYYLLHKNNHFIFESNEKPLAEVSIQRILKTACEKSNINKRLTPHVFRHTHASTLIDKGLPIIAVADRLGHDDITTTLKTYAHAFNKIDTRAADIFDNL